MKTGKILIIGCILLSFVACNPKNDPDYPSNSDYRLVKSEQNITMDGTTKRYIYSYSYNETLSIDGVDYLQTVVEENAETNETTTYTYNYLSTNPIKYTIKSTNSESTYEYNATNGKLEKSVETTNDGTKQSTITAEYEYNKFFVIKKQESAEIIEDLTKTVTNSTTQYSNSFNEHGQLTERTQTAEIQTISYEKTNAEDATWNETNRTTNTEISKDVYAYYQDSLVQQTYLQEANTGVFEQKPYQVTTTTYIPEISLILRRVQTTYYQQDEENHKKGDLYSVVAISYTYKKKVKN